MSNYEAIFGQKYHPALRCTLQDWHQCKTISERLCDSPNLRLQSYAEENNIVESPTASVEHEKEDDSIDEDDIGEDADVDLGDDNNHDDIKDDRDGDNNDYHYTLVVIMMMRKMSRVTAMRLCLLKQESLPERRLPFLMTSCLQL